MKKFKEFIKENKPKSFFNVHGEHAKNSKQPEPKKSFTNTHGEHSKKVLEAHQKDIFGYDDNNVYHLGTHFLQKDLNSHLGDSPDEKMDTLNNLHRLSRDQTGPLQKYTSNSYHLNRQLVDNHNEGITTKKSAVIEGHHVGALDKVFHPSNENFHTYSGAGFNIKDIDHAGYSEAGNKVYKLPAYMSSTHNKDVALGFARRNREEYSPSQILHWEHEKGQPLAVIGRHSAYAHEHETLIPRTDATPEKYHAEHIGTSRYKDADGDEYEVHHLRRIPKSEVKKSKPKL